MIANAFQIVSGAYTRVPLAIMPATIAPWFGLFIFVAGTGIAVFGLYRHGVQKKYFAIGLLSAVNSVLLLAAPRLEEVTLSDLAKIKFAKDQALADASEIATIKERIAGQAATIDLIAQEAARAKALSEEAQKAVDKATASVAAVNEDRRDQLEVGSLAEIDWSGNYTVGGTGISTRFSQWSKDPNSEKFFVRRKDSNSIEWDCDDAAIAQYESTMKSLPIFPFPAILLADCLKKRGANESEWLPIAEGAATTLRKVIKVPGHLPDYEHFLQFAERIIQNESIPH